MGITVEEPRASDASVMISSTLDIDCVVVPKEDIPELINKLEAYNESNN